MVIKKNKEKTIENFIKGDIDTLEVLIPNIADRTMDYVDEVLELDKIINESVDIKTHTDGMSPALFMYGLLSAKLKRLFSITEATLAITSSKLIKKFDINITNDKGFTCEGNIRKFIKKMGTASEVTAEEVATAKDKIERKNKSKKEQNPIDESVIKNNLQTKKNGHEFVKFFNTVMEKIINKIEHPKIHILDCVKMVVNKKNNNYELSTVINYEGEVMRGYKMGVLRGVTDTGGIIEYLIDGTIADSDISLVEKEVSEYSSFEEGDHLLMDRGFAKIEFIISLLKRKINVIVPAKKNMDIFKESIKLAIESENGWSKHPNDKRKGQDIKLITNLKGIWIPEKDRTKKPEKIMENAPEFNACVVRIDKTISSNQEVIEAAQKATDETDEIYEDERYIYLVILSTDLTLSAAEIIRYYEMRPEIEEDFRQLKDIWKMCSFNSTKYIFVMCQICMTFLAYNLFNIYKTSSGGEKYIGKSMKRIANEEKRVRVPFNETSYVITSGSYYYIFSGVELLDMYGECTMEIREKIKCLLT